VLKWSGIRSREILHQTHSLLARFLEFRELLIEHRDFARNYAASCDNLSMFRDGRR
jgi:hypothetical protein